MGTFSSSPGSIYPALKKLVKAGLIEKREPAAGHKQLFHITASGQREMKAWLCAPVTHAEVANSVDLALLRFAFLQNVNDPEVTRKFLASFISAVRVQIESLESYIASPDGGSLSLHGRLALEHGLRSYKAHLDWGIHADREFKS